MYHCIWVLVSCKSFHPLVFCLSELQKITQIFIIRGLLVGQGLYKYTEVDLGFLAEFVFRLLGHETKRDRKSHR